MSNVCKACRSSLLSRFRYSLPPSDGAPSPRMHTVMNCSKLLLRCPDRIIVFFDLRAESVFRGRMVNVVSCRQTAFAISKGILLPHALIPIFSSFATCFIILRAPRGSKFPLDCNTGQSDRLHYGADCECKPDADSIYHWHDETGSSSSEQAPCKV